MAKFTDIREMSHSNYEEDVPWVALERWLKRLDEDFGLELDPDYQRGYVWTEKQKTQYLEWVLRGGISGKEIFWNVRGFNTSSMRGPAEIIDGKQRLSAVRDFLNDKVPVYGHYFREYTDSLRMASPASFRMHIHCMGTKAEILQWYLDMNTGGTVHSDEEIQRVTKLLKECTEKGIAK